MEIVYATVLGLGIGAVLRYLIPGRHAYGIFLLPAIGAAVVAASWTGLTWLGWKPGGTWIWVVTMIAAGAICIVVALTAPRVRARVDERMLHQLSGGHA